MFEIDPDLYPAESVSSLALDVIDELRMKMLECLLVLEALPDQADLNFDELANDILAAHRNAQNTYQAASLVHQGAELNERWGNSLSRPKAIFARHSAAVREGARQIKPLPALCDQLERQLWRLPALDRTQDFVGERPKCCGVVRATGENCMSSAIYLGSGLFGAHCYSHATPPEREQYRAYHESVSSRQAQSHEELAERRRVIGEHIADHWISTREQRIQWADKVAPSTDMRQ